MDISLCTFNPKSNQIEFAGANNPLWIIRKANGATSDPKAIVANEKALIEIKGDKQAIGKTSNPKSFSNHTIKLEKGDYAYLFSDGYADQFGGPKGKKFKYKPFKNLLLEICELPMNEQKEILIKQFEDWRGELEQIDDVCVIGVRV